MQLDTYLNKHKGYKQGDLFVVAYKIYGLRYEIGEYIIFIREDKENNLDIYFNIQRGEYLFLTHLESHFSIKKLEDK
jgi:hypothetical protein